MIARCAKCQSTFSTDRYGSQFCPNCGSEIFLRDPNAPAPPPANNASPGAGAASPGEAPGGAPGTGAASPSGAPAAAGPATSPEATPGAWAPWEDRGNLTLIASFVETVKQSVFNPSRFFSVLRADQARGAYTYGLLLWFVASFASSFWNAMQSLAFGASQLTKFLPMTGENADVLKRLEEFQSPRWAITSMVMSPVSAVIGFFIITGVLHLMVMLFCSGGRGWNATVRAVAYSSGPLLLALIPACGGIIGQVWAMGLTIFSVMHLHKTSGGRAAAAVLVPIAVLFCCACAAGILMIAGIGAMGAALGSGHSL